MNKTHLKTKQKIWLIYLYNKKIKPLSTIDKNERAQTLYFDRTNGKPKVDTLYIKFAMRNKIKCLKTNFLARFVSLETNSILKIKILKITILLLNSYVLF